jgi:hypothetical protein
MKDRNGKQSGITCGMTVSRQWEITRPGGDVERSVGWNPKNVGQPCREGRIRYRIPALEAAYGEYRVMLTDGWRKGEIMVFQRRLSLLAGIICIILLATSLVVIMPCVCFGNDTKARSDEISGLIQKYLNERNRVLVSSDPGKNSALDVPMIKLSNMTEVVAENQISDVEKIAAVTKKVEDQGYRYWDHFDTKVSVKVVSEKQGRIVARANEYTCLYFCPEYYRPGIGAEGEYSSFVADRDFTFIEGSSGLIISDIKVASAIMPPPNEPSVKPVIPEPREYEERSYPKAVEGDKISEQPVAPSGKGFSGQAIVDYCNMYAVNPNTQWYPYWSNADCTNFISQALYYAGWGYTGSGDHNILAWYCHRHTLPWVWYQYTDTFVNAQQWKGHILATGRAIDTADYNGLRVGDVIQLDLNYPSNQYLDHSMIVSRNDAWHYSGKYTSQHTGNRRNYPLLSVLASWPNSRYWYSLTRTY